MLALVIVGTLALACSAAAPDAVGKEGLQRAGRSLTEYKPLLGLDSPDPGNVLVVTLLDGRVVAVQQDSGHVLWTYDTGTPLVTVKQGQAMAPRGLRIFPGVDGGLYAYGPGLVAADGEAAGGTKLERLPITLPELVDASPSLTDDGSVILGKRLTRVYVLDRATGLLLQQLSDASLGPAGPGEHGGMPGGRTFGIEDMPVLQVLDPERTVVVGREDYVVRSVQVQTGVETWNATYSRMINLRPRGAAAGVGAGPAAEARLPAGREDLPHFTVSADHTLQAHDPASAIRRWSIAFDTPPVGVFAATHGEVNYLDPAVASPGAAAGSAGTGVAGAAAAGRRRGGGGASVPVGREGEPMGLPGPGGAGEAAAGAVGKRVLVGQLRGCLYALPADRVVLDAAAEALPMGALAIVGRPSGAATSAVPQLPAAAGDGADGGVRGAAGPGSDKALVVVGAGGTSSTDVMTYMTEAESGEGVVSGLVCPPGLHLLATVDEPREPREPLPWLPDAAKAAASRAAANAGAATATAAPDAGGTLLPVAVVAAGVAGAAAVLVVFHVRGVATGKAAAAAAALDAAADAVSSSAGGSGGKGGRSGGRNGSGGAGSNGGHRRRKGGNTGGRSSAMSSAGGSEGQLPLIEEDRVLATDEIPPMLVTPVPSDAATAARLPSAEERVRVREDGSLAIGRLVVGPGILGYGSAGTVVYEGVLDGRPVAVKRLLRQFTELARKEIEVLILSDEHPNVVRCFAMEEDREFVYLALERCRSALSDLLSSDTGRAAFVAADSKQPTPRCFSAMLDVCRGLAALHERGIVHRDLKPHNVLLTETTCWRAKLSDMGLSKQLVPEQSSFHAHDSLHGPGGSSGWQAPEQLIARDGGAARQTRSMDVFSLGCILHYCMTGGRHPFGDNHYERDSNILHGQPALASLAGAGPEAANLVAACLAKDPSRRPSVTAVLGHPLWWGEERRLAFLVDISDRIENEDREPDQSLLEALESHARVALAGPGPAPGDAWAEPPQASTAASPATAALLAALAPLPNWGAAVPSELVANLGRYRRYDYTSLRDLLRVVRNKRNHFREMPPSLQAMLGPIPGGFLRFFTARFPRLLLAVYVFGLQHLSQEPALQQYWTQRGAGGEAAGPAGAAGAAAFVQVFNAQYGASLKPIKPVQAPQSLPPLPAAAATPTGASDDEGSATPVRSAATTPAPAGTPHASAARPADDDSAAAVATPTAAGPATSTSATAPPPSPPPPPSPAPLVLVGYEPTGDDGAVHVREFPRRPGKQLCEFYSKTGHCKFGETCVFDHPETYAVLLTTLGLPLRPGEPVCTFYLKNNECRFGPACKFHHPMLRPVFAGSAAGAPDPSAS
ncbi:hypothetical protein HYH03_016532 [Edaphochlamys debaryana]|uniref:non-specific serine/threonine protein kinase n=1 Tax=Edaphochlamys debaryana TaxID=47281 RepID=A0A836BRD8_9CHLO|nr:hypothetical protein HYH03_016532 [Edaphochlamys debaryana]|eukprot:KAG2484704.1 hypothetical protein HYH03_016532 [Edaphochlamys debaryana]